LSLDPTLAQRISIVYGGSTLWLARPVGVVL
jgi:hypothetical protein